jgi:hypothetical protein
MSEDAKATPIASIDVAKAVVAAVLGGRTFGDIAKAIDGYAKLRVDTAVQEVLDRRVSATLQGGESIELSVREILALSPAPEPPGDSQ